MTLVKLTDQQRAREAAEAAERVADEAWARSVAANAAVRTARENAAAATREARAAHVAAKKALEIWRRLTEGGGYQ